MARKGLYGVTKGKWQMSNFSDNYHPPCGIITDANLADVLFIGCWQQSLCPVKR